MRSLGQTASAAAVILDGQPQSSVGRVPMSLRSLCLASAAVVAALGLATPVSAQQKPIKIAFIQDLTGPLEAYAKQEVTGFHLGLEYATKGTMMVAGRKIEVI